MTSGPAGEVVRSAGCEAAVVKLTPALRRVELRGRLPVGWAGQLASGLASRKMSIVRGWACERSGAQWESQFQVLLPADGPALTAATALWLASPDASAPQARMTDLRLLHHRVERSGSELLVEIEGIDQRGFLDRVLRLFALYGLFPCELRLETDRDRARDVFRLRGLQGRLPEPATTHAVAAHLLRLMARDANAAPRG